LHFNTCHSAERQGVPLACFQDPPLWQHGHQDLVPDAGCDCCPTIVSIYHIMLHYHNASAQIVRQQLVWTTCFMFANHRWYCESMVHTLASALCESSFLFVAACALHLWKAWNTLIFGNWSLPPGKINSANVWWVAALDFKAKLKLPPVNASLGHPA
jgi:hypothetical protein